MTVYGVTGSRKIQTQQQREHIREVIYLYAIPGVDSLVHGCCVGVDRECAMAAVDHDLKRIVALVPPNRSLVSDVARAASDEIVEITDGPDGYKRRNQEIVNRSDVLLAFPMYPENHPLSRRSGTWQTIRMARRAGIPVHEYILSEVGQ